MFYFHFALHPIFVFGVILQHNRLGCAFNAAHEGPIAHHKLVFQNVKVQENCIFFDSQMVKYKKKHVFYSQTVKYMFLVKYNSHFCILEQ